MHADGNKTMPDDETEKSESPVEESELLRVRRSKLQALLDAGVEPYRPFYGEPDEVQHAADLAEKYASLEAGASSGQTAAVAGRLVAKREHGKATFGDIKDTSGKIQLLLRHDTLGEERYRQFSELDLGDWVGAAGEILRSRRGELSLAVSSWELL